MSTRDEGEGGGENERMDERNERERERARKMEMEMELGKEVLARPYVCDIFLRKGEWGMSSGSMAIREGVPWIHG